MSRIMIMACLDQKKTRSAIFNQTSLGGRGITREMCKFIGLISKIAIVVEVTPGRKLEVRY